MLHALPFAQADQAARQVQLALVEGAGHPAVWTHAEAQIVVFLLLQSVSDGHQVALKDLRGCSVAQTFARRGIEALANRPQISICQSRRFGRAGQVLSQPAIRVLDRSFLPWCLRIAEPARGADPALQPSPCRKLGAAVKHDRLACSGA